MQVVGLISGGKDSCYNLMCAVREGHKVAALANLYPPKSSKTDELDSYMYQSVGADGVEVSTENTSYFKISSSDYENAFPIYRGLLLRILEISVYRHI